VGDPFQDAYTWRILGVLGMATLLICGSTVAICAFVWFEDWLKRRGLWH
jgi:hypothetical protein